MKPVILYYNHLLNAASLSANESSSGYPITNILDYRTYTKWKAQTTGTKVIYVSWGSSIFISAIGFAGHNIKNLELINEDTSETIINRSISDNKAKLFVFNRVEASSVKIRVTNNSEVPYIGVIFLAEYLEMPEYPDAPYSPIQEEVERDESFNVNGKLIGVNYKYSRVKTSLRLSNVSNSWKSKFDLFWETHGKLGKPFFYAYDLDNEPDAVIYGRLVSNYNLPRTIRNYIDSIDLEIEGER